MAEFLRNPSEGKSIAYKYNNIYIYIIIIIKKIIIVIIIIT